MASLESSTTALWEAWRRLHLLYVAIARESLIDPRPCPDLDLGNDAPSSDAVTESEAWFTAMDNCIHTHHLRHFAQTSLQMNEQAVSDLLFHAIHKKQKNEQDRDKVDFLVVQLLAMRLPPAAKQSEITMDSVLKMLGPIVGSSTAEVPNLVEQIENLLGDAERASTLNTLFTSRVIERSRELKEQAGDDFFLPISLAAFARYGYLIRRRFFQLMQQDRNAILDGLQQLESRGVSTIDCRKAQFSAEEPILRIRMICQSWRVMFQAEYSAGQPLCLLVDLKSAVEQALNQSAGPLPAEKKAAAAGVSGAVSVRCR